MVTQLVSHSLYLLIALVAIVLIIGGFSAFRNDVEKISTESSLNLIADTVKQEIIRLYSSSEESGKSEIPLQSRLGERPYIIQLASNKVIVTLDGFEVEKKISINANLDGTASLPAFLVLSKTAGVKTISLVNS